MNNKFQTHNADFHHLDTMIVIGYSLDSTTQQIDSDFNKEVRNDSSASAHSYSTAVRIWSPLPANPLNFNELGRIKSVHQVFIFKNISHLIADYTGTANLNVNVGVRMPVNPGINPAVGNQVSVFTGKGAVQHGTSMIRSHYLKCRQMMCNHDNMGRSAFLDAFSDKTNTRLVHQVEVIHLKQLLAELYLAEVIYAFRTKHLSFWSIRICYLYF